MKKVLSFILAGVLMLSVFAIPAVTFDANDYGGDYDWGDDDGWGDSDDDNRSVGAGGIRDSGGGSDSGGGGYTGIIVLAVVIAIVVIVSKNKKGTNSSSAGGASVVKPASYQGLNVTLPDRTAQIEGIIKGKDPNFSANDFISFAKEVYIDIQNAWCKRDMSPVRPVLHDNLYNSTEKQVQAKIEQGVIYHYESIVVNTAYLTGYAKDAQFEYLTIYLNARMTDWQEDEKTGNILRGDKNTRWDLRYKMKFMRSAGVTTKEEVAEAQGHNCPNCGAPLEISSSGKCGYCDSVVTTGQYSWVLSDFGTVRNDTVDEGVTGE